MAIKVYSPTDFEDTSSGVSIDGDFAVDTNTFFVDVSTDRVGVGTSSPAYKLHVTGDAILAGASKLYLRDSLTYITESNGLILDSGHSTRVTKFLIGGSEKLRIHTDGNVGIGTTSPLQKLHVEGNIHMNGNQLRFPTNISYLQLTNVSGSWNSLSAKGINIGDWSTQPSYGDIRVGDYDFDVIKTDGTHLIKVKNNGNVLIGTTTDSGAKLEVAGSVGNFKTTGHQIFLTRNGNNEIYAVGASSVLALGTNSAEKMRITSGGSLLIGDTAQGYSPTTQGYLLGVKSNTTQAFISIAKSGQTLDSQGMIVGLSTDTGYVWMRQSVDLTFGTNNVDRMRITSGGNVGIGTTSPGAKLHVNGDVIRVVNSTWSGIESHNTNGSWESFVGTESGGGGNRYNSASSKHTFYNNSNAVMTINSSGNVGIGTTSPNNKLDVRRANSGIVAEFHSTAGTPDEYADIKLISGNGTAGTYGTILRHQRVGTSGADFAILTNPTLTGTPVERLRVTKDGNVGIGTTSPAYKLEIKGTSNNIGDGNQIFSVGNTSGGTQLAIGSSEDSYTWIRSYESGVGGRDLSLVTNGEAIRIKSGGNVLIGTNTDSGYKLDVNGTTRTGNLTLPGGTFTGTSENATVLRFDGGSSSYEYFLGRAGAARTWSGKEAFMMHTDSAKSIAFFSSGWVKLLEVEGTSGNTRVAGTLTVGGLNVDSGTLYVDSTNNRVGIGTTSPGAKLQISSGNNVDTQLIVGEGSAYGAPSIRFKTASTNYMGLGFTTGSVVGNEVLDAIAIQRTGNVGIGTTSPAYKLSVNGDIQIPQNEYIYFDNTSHYIRRGPSNVEIQGYNGLDLRTNGSTRLFIDQPGNVGVGTTSPVTGLDVRTSTYSNTTARFGETRPVYIINNEPIIGFNQYYDSGWKAGSSGYSGYIGMKPSNGDMYFRLSTQSNAANAAVAETTPLYILNNGNIGIGTTSPDQKLHVSGNTKTTNLYVAGDIIHDGDSDTKIQFNTDAINFDTAGVERLRIDNIGNIGIGTTSPALKLHLAHSDGNNGLLLEHTSQASSYSILQNIRQNEGLIWQRWINGVFNSNLMTLSYDGNLGIGTASPSAKLDIVGDGADFFLQSNDFKIARIQPRGTGADLDKGLFSLFDGSAEDVRIDTAGSSWFNGGNVGIGTASPSSKLHVNGTFKSIGIQDSSTSQAIFINGNAEVGIGTASPTNKLHVVGNLFLKGSDTSSSTKNFQVQTGNGTSIMDFRNDAYAFFGCGQGGGSASGFIFRYNSTFGVQFTGYNYGNGTSPSYKPILMDTDLAGRSQGVYINYGITGYTAPAPTSDTEFAVRGRGTSSNYTAKFEDSSTNPLLYIKDNGNVTVGSSTDNGYKLDVEGNTNTNGDYYVNGNQGWSGTITIDQSPNPPIDITVEGGIITNVT